MKKTAALVITVLMALAVLGLAGCAKKEVQMKIGIDPSFPPMGFVGDNGEYVGFDIDLAKEVAKRLGYTYKFVAIDWNQKDTEMETGNINMIWNGYTVDAERKAKYSLSKAYMQNNQVVMVLVDSSYQTLDDLKDKQIAIQSKSTAVDAVDANPEFKNKIKLREVKDNELARTELDTGASEAVALDSVVAEYMITKNPGKYRILSQILLQEEYAIAFNKSDTKLHDAVQAELDKMVQDGTFKTISETWFGKDVSIQ